MGRRCLVGFAVLIALVGTSRMPVAKAGSTGGSGLIATIAIGEGGRDDLALDLAALSTVTQEGKVYQYTGSYDSEDFDLSWDLLLDPDPVVAGSFGFANNTAAFKNFTVTLTQPALPPLASSLTGGSVSGSVTDGNFSGSATIKTQPGLPLYTSLIDGVIWQTLLSDPFSTVAGFGSAAITPASFGTPIPSLPGPGVTTDIGVTLNFQVSPGDVASLTFNFSVVPVPEPSSIALALAGLVGVVALVRRLS